MKIALLLLAATSFSCPVTATGQALTSATRVENAQTIPYATIEADRVGVSPNKPLDEASLRIRSDAFRVHVVDHYRHAVIGGFFGLLGGAAIGAAAGAVADARADEVMVPATAIGAIYGGVGGLVLGLLIGVAWPVR